MKDRDGALWVRLNAVHWHCAAPTQDNRQTWEEIDAVTVLAEGVTP